MQKGGVPSERIKVPRAQWWKKNEPHFQRGIFEFIYSSRGELFASFVVIGFVPRVHTQEKIKWSSNSTTSWLINKFDMVGFASVRKSPSTFGVENDDNSFLVLDEMDDHV